MKGLVEQIFIATLVVTVAGCSTGRSTSPVARTMTSPDSIHQPPNTSQANPNRYSFPLPASPNANQKTAQTVRKSAETCPYPGTAAPGNPERESVDAVKILAAKIATAYRHFEYAQVIALTEELLARENATREQLTNALVWAGAASYLQGNAQTAQGYFEEAIGLNPQLRINRGAFPEAILELFDETKTRRR